MDQKVTLNRGHHRSQGHGGVDEKKKKKKQRVTSDVSRLLTKHQSSLESTSAPRQQIMKCHMCPCSFSTLPRTLGSFIISQSRRRRVLKEDREFRTSSQKVRRRPHTSQLLTEPMTRPGAHRRTVNTPTGGWRLTVGLCYQFFTRVSGAHH